MSQGSRPANTSLTSLNQTCWSNLFVSRAHFPAIQGYPRQSRKTSSKSASSNLMHEWSVVDNLDFRDKTIGVDWTGYFSIPILLLEWRLQSCIDHSQQGLSQKYRTYDKFNGQLATCNLPANLGVGLKPEVHRRRFSFQDSSTVRLGCARCPDFEARDHQEWLDHFYKGYTRCKTSYQLRRPEAGIADLMSKSIKGATTKVLLQKSPKSPPNHT